MPTWRPGALSSFPKLSGLSNLKAQRSSTCFWSLQELPSFRASRWAASAHWAVSRLVRFFMKIRDSFPLPISSRRWDRLLRKTAWRGSRHGFSSPQPRSRATMVTCCLGAGAGTLPGRLGCTLASPALYKGLPAPTVREPCSHPPAPTPQPSLSQPSPGHPSVPSPFVCVCVGGVVSNDSFQGSQLLHGGREGAGQSWRWDGREAGPL